MNKKERTANKELS